MVSLPHFHVVFAFNPMENLTHGNTFTERKVYRLCVDCVKYTANFMRIDVICHSEHRTTTASTLKKKNCITYSIFSPKVDR